MKPEVQEELQPLFDRCIQDTIDGRIIRLDSLWPPVVVSSEGAPFEVHDLVRKWAELQRAETLDAEKAIAFSENLRRQSRWGEIDYYLRGLLEQELQEKYFVVTGREDDHRWNREYSLKPGIRAEEVPEPLLRFACYVAVSYKVYGMDFEYLDTNYLLGLVEKVRPDMVKKLRENGTGRLPISLQKRKTEHFTASANDAGAGGFSPQLCGGVQRTGKEVSAHHRTAQKGSKPALCLCRAIPQPPPPDGTVRPACHAAI